MTNMRTESGGIAPPLPGEAILQSQHAGLGMGWHRFCNPSAVLVAHRLDQVQPTLRAVQQAADAGRHAIGWVAYEAAPAFDVACRVRTGAEGPLAWFALYEEAEPFEWPAGDSPSVSLPWAADVDLPAYSRKVRRIRKWIARGHTYQVNFTFRFSAPSNVEPWLLFRALTGNGAAGFGAYIDTGNQVLCSASPELFFLREGERVTCRPMKGTAPRGRTLAEDHEQMRTLRASAKDRAENVMIVDMMRNDLGRLARPGSVQVDTLFDVTRYPTLFQMTSTLHADVDADLPALFGALFPCASVTGAPKIRTMELIADLETSARGAYTGAIGWVGPGNQAQFNVGIRTAEVNRRLGTVRYGAGSGIVWDSAPSAEFDECLTKARILATPRPAFRLLETMRWEPGRGLLFLDRHLARLRDSAEYFQFAVEPAAVRAALEGAARTFPAVAQRVRLLAARDGALEIETRPLQGSRFVDEPEQAMEAEALPWAGEPVNREEIFLYHKTTCRDVYEARRAAAGTNDLLLWNEVGEMTETCIGNLVARFGSDWLTPPISCGLLGGAYRAALLARGRLREQVLSVAEAKRAEGLYRINSVRGWTRLIARP